MGWNMSSALARNCHTLLAKSDPRHRYVLVPGFGAYWSATAACHAAISRCEERFWPHVRPMNSWRLTAFQGPRCGDDATANRPPSAWMISLFSLPTGKSCSLLWVTLGERKWSILAERRRFWTKAEH